MIAIDYDKRTYNTVATLKADLDAAQAAHGTAKAVSDALSQRLSAFSAELDIAKARLSTAKSDSAAADTAEQSVDGVLLESLRATRQALIIYVNARSMLALAEGAARQAIAAGYDVSETLSYVTSASAKNSFITRKLLVVSEQADADASAAVNAAVSALKDVTDAFIAAERAVGAAFLVVASLVNLQRLMSGYRRAPLSNEDEMSSALNVVPALELSRMLKDVKDANDVRELDRFLLEQTPELYSQDILNRLLDDYKYRPGADLLEGAVTQYMADTEKLRAEGVASVNAEVARFVVGLQPGFRGVLDTAQEHEDELQRATTLTQQVATDASQDLSRKAARLQTAQQALAAAQQAAGR